MINNHNEEKDFQSFIYGIGFGFVVGFLLGSFMIINIIRG